jgi:predicted methyltransferase
MLTVLRASFLSIPLIVLLAASGQADDVSLSSTLQEAAVSGHRSAENQARNESRHPVETLEFFGIRDDLSVVEITPGGGWYTEILAVLLRTRGKLYAANYDTESADEYYSTNARRFLEKLAADPDIYDRVIATVFDPPARLDAAPPGSADMVLTFRNVHNWMEEGSESAAFSAMYRALKPGGILGVVQHRQDSGVEQDPRAESGYVREDYVIALAEAAGFSFIASSEINANPKDIQEYPEGVWTLPPTYELGEVDHDVYAAIGESDRMTLKFVRQP